MVKNMAKRRSHGHIRASMSDRVFNAVNVVVMVVLSFVFLYPFWYTLVLSLSDVAESSELGLKFFVRHPTLESYRIVLSSPQVGIALFNTVFRTVTGALLSTVITFCGAAALARRDLPGRTMFQTIIIITMFFSGGLIPTFLLVKSLGMLDSYWALLLPGLTNCWFTLICRNFIQSLPSSFEESALIDGANPVVITFRIILPLSMPIIAVLVLQFGVGHWNSYFDAMIYNHKQHLIVFQQLLRQVLIDQTAFENDAFSGHVLTETTKFTSPQTVKSATVMVATLPIVCVYPFLQKYFVKGILLGGLKG